MSYRSINIQSSYLENDLGKCIYDVVVRLKPKKVVEFGTLKGYSAIAIAMALRDNGYGHLYAYDLWEKYPHKHEDQNTCRDNLRKYGLENYVTLDQIDFWEWLKEPEEFDLLHLDISNTGYIISSVAEALHTHVDKGATILFEGGSDDRDKVDWMIKFDKQPIFPLKDVIGYKILSEKYPSISIIEKQVHERVHE